MKYEFTIVHKYVVDLSNPGYWDSDTHAAAAVQEARFLQGLDGQGDYLSYALDSPDCTVHEISYQAINDE